MKMALIVPGGVDRSGTRRVIPVLLALIKRLAMRYELHVYALYQENGPEEWELLGARIHNIGHGWTRVRAVQAIRRQHRTAPFGLIQAFFSGNCGLIAVSAGRMLGIPALVHVAGVELLALKNISYGGRLTWRGRVREWWVLRAATMVTAASAPMVAALAELGITAQRLPLGVDLEVWPSRAPAPRPAESTARLVHVGSLNRIKDQSTLLRAFSIVASDGADVHLDVVGEDTLHNEIQSEAQALRIADRITFHGFLTQSDLRPVMEASHLLVMSSLHEAGPIVVLEAAVVGVPTVGTAVGHIAEWAPQAALAAPLGDSAGIAGYIKMLLGDERRRVQLAFEAQRLALCEDSDHTARRFEQLYATLGCS
jgi:glycosyltransferase involved in cell wall biosynthesis